MKNLLPLSLLLLIIVVGVALIYAPVPENAQVAQPTETVTLAPGATETASPSPSLTRTPGLRPSPTAASGATPAPTSTLAPAPTRSPVPALGVPQAQTTFREGQGAVEVPGPNATVASRFAIRGWAFDPSQTRDCGIGQIEVWDGPAGTGAFVGFAYTPVTRLDISTRFNQQAYGQCGFSFLTPPKPEGTHRWYVYPIARTGETLTPLTLEVRVDPLQPLVSIAVDSPGSSVTQITPTVAMSGWALDLGSDIGAGISKLEIWLGPQETGTLLTEAAFKPDSRPDLVAVFGATRWGSAGWSAEVKDLPTGPVELYVYAYSAVDGKRYGPAILRKQVVQP